MVTLHLLMAKMLRNIQVYNKFIIREVNSYIPLHGKQNKIMLEKSDALSRIRTHETPRSHDRCSS